MEERTRVLLEKLVQSGIRLLPSESSAKKLRVGALGPFITMTGQIYDGLIVIPEGEFFLGYELIPVQFGMCLKSVRCNEGISLIHMSSEENRNLTVYELHSSKSTKGKIPPEIYLEKISFDVYEHIRKKQALR